MTSITGRVKRFVNDRLPRENQNFSCDRHYILVLMSAFQFVTGITIMIKINARQSTGGVTAFTPVIRPILPPLKCFFQQIAQVTISVTVLTVLLHDFKFDRAVLLTSHQCADDNHRTWPD